MWKVHILAFLGLLASTGAWDTPFKALNCYTDRGSSLDINGLVDSRMPISMDNFIALVEKYERQHSMDDAGRIADALISRYRKDGMVYFPDQSSLYMFQPKETFETNKQEILRNLLSSSFEVPVDTFEHREECSLHFMMSHSTDTYPHPGINDFWTGSGRYRRDFTDSALSHYPLGSGQEPATHPIENGVILSSYGPIALGTLLAGISTTLGGSEQTIASVLGENHVAYMPDEMKVKRLNPLYIATLSGDIGQTALKASDSPSNLKSFVGPYGKFSNSTAAPKLFTLKDGNDGVVTYLTRAEIFAGIDAMVINKYLSSSSTSRVKLSQTLRMYYSDRGLPNLPNFKACNRMEAYNSVRDDAKTKEQALNFMYAFAHYNMFARQYIEENKDHFDDIESYYTRSLNDAWSPFTSFVESYNYEDYDRCTAYNKDQVKCESTVDLVVVYNSEGGVSDSQAQREYITLLAQKIGVGQDRSRLGVLDANKNDWLMPVTNVSNVADLGANFTLDSQKFGSRGSSADMMKILETLAYYYMEFYNNTLSSGQNATASSQVVVWNVARSAPDFNNEDNLKLIRDFHLEFPNVYFLLVGNNQADYVNVLHDRENDFFKINLQNTEETASKIAQRVCQIPSVFIYPACDTDQERFKDYREDTHIFKGYVSPNYTTYAMISPQVFKYSYKVELTLQSADIKVCASRVSMTVDSNAQDIQCQEASNEKLEWLELCTDSNLTLCHPIYLSISGTPSGTPRCDATDCEFPDQVEYKIGHTGLLCGAASLRISLLLVAILALLQYYLV
ncbi:uncharacterized protein [Palaemon carinicauda]|uniref:uncharacterized protein n=1 Tax=Palaemon carinicauda TaxID=392227 RepID=UPI0035B574DF